MSTDNINEVNIFDILNEEINIFNKNEDSKGNNRIINYNNNNIYYKILFLDEVYITITSFIEIIISKSNINREINRLLLVNRFKKDNVIYINRRGFKEFINNKLSKSSLTVMKGRLNKINFNKYYNYLKFIKMNINNIFM